MKISGKLILKSSKDPLLSCPWFPLPAVQSAGKRLGKEDPRHLWPYMCRAIHIIHPAWIVAENVYGIVIWQEGMIFEEVHAQLENEGYEAGTFILPAAGINAPHRRYRVFFVAHQNTDSDGRQGNIRQKPSQSRQFRDACAGIDERQQNYIEQIGAVADTHDNRNNSGYSTVQKKDAKIPERDYRPRPVPAQDSPVVQTLLDTLFYDEYEQSTYKTR